ncbi:MAG: glycine--tRNA ligase subunit beta [Neisseriaceae bacterium]|nr:MAG: glycine--tRNA ligase subunit beta [Neisseriaceae bacterium]
MSNLQNNLLIEFLSEELPPINLEKNIGVPFGESIVNQLSSFLDKNHQVRHFVAPRRFGIVINGVNFEESDQQILRKGPAVATALVNGAPTNALLGFAKSCNVDWQKLEQRDDGYFYFQTTQKGRALNDVITDVIGSAIKKIHIAKAMRWGDKDYQFVRPLHNLVVMFDDQVLDCNVMGLTATNSTLGHRFMSSGQVIIPHACEYFNLIQETGKVVPEFKLRKDKITQQLNDAASKLNLQISHIDGLLDEVTALVEYPEVLVGEFDKKFLDVPQECLILSMAKNQKYFALVDKQNKLNNKFLFVANLKSKDSQVIIDGNQKVLTARLADAEFFYNFDKRTKLQDFVPKMANVVYHNKLGSQLERIERLQKIASAVAPFLGVDVAIASKTAYLLKADLSTEMVGEFPELQGIMGNYYAKASGEDDEVANAIEKHYYPRFSGDELPDSKLATVVSLADKLETIVGIWGIGLIPTGDKDPYALRRAALGIIRILLVNNLDLRELLKITIAAFAGKNFAGNLSDDLYAFFIQRLSNYLTIIENYSAKVVNAVLANQNLDINNVLTVCKSFAVWASNESNASLFEANKRIENILKKNAEDIDVSLVVDETKFNDYEKKLFTLVTTIDQSLAIDDYLTKLSQLATPLADFFANVMVIDEDISIRKNRLSLLTMLYDKFNYYGKLSELV